MTLLTSERTMVGSRRRTDDAPTLRLRLQRPTTDDETTSVYESAQAFGDEPTLDTQIEKAREKDLVEIEWPCQGQMVLWRHGWKDVHVLTPEVIPAQVLDATPRIAATREAGGTWPLLAHEHLAGEQNAPAGWVRLLAHTADGNVMVVERVAVLTGPGQVSEEIWRGRAGYDELPLVPYGEERPGMPAQGCWCYGNPEQAATMRVPRRGPRGGVL